MNQSFDTVHEASTASRKLALPWPPISLVGQEDCGVDVDTQRPKEKQWKTII